MKFKNEDYAGLILFIIGLFYLVFITYTGFNNWGVWFDEIFSFRMIQLPIHDMINLGISDVHPLLYYFIFKLIYKLLSPFNLNIVFIGIIVSLIPMYLLTLLNITKIRKNFGLLTCGIFMLCIFSMPELMKYCVEIRMYSWALFFVTASFIYIYETVKNPTYKNWILLTIFVICSSHTHYIATLSVCVLSLLFLVYILKNNRELLKGWIISTIVSILAFIPWITGLIAQINRVRADFWIPPISPKSLLDYLFYILIPDNGSMLGINNYIKTPLFLFAVLFLIAIIMIFYYSFKNNNFDDVTKYGFLTVLLVPFIGIIISIIVKPIFIQRYIITFIGIFYLSLSILIAKLYSNKKLFLAIILVILVVGAVSATTFVMIQENEYKITVDKFNQLNSEIGSGNTIYVDNYEIYVLLDSFFLCDNNIILINSSSEITPNSYFFDCKKPKEINYTDISYNKTKLNINAVNYIDTTEFSVYKIYD